MEWLQNKLVLGLVLQDISGENEQEVQASCKCVRGTMNCGMGIWLVQLTTRDQ